MGTRRNVIEVLARISTALFERVRAALFTVALSTLARATLALVTLALATPALATGARAASPLTSFDYVFDEAACRRFEFGSIACGATYRANYDTATRKWRISGPTRPDGTVVTADYAVALEPADGLNHWGVVVTRKHRALYRDGVRVGTIVDEPGRAALATRPAYARLAAQLDAAYPGRGFEPLAGKVADDPMAYGLVAFAAARAGDVELAYRAVGWLLGRCAASGEVCRWGASFAWDAFQDGSVNPEGTLYGVNVAVAAMGLMAFYERVPDPRVRATVSGMLSNYDAHVFRDGSGQDRFCYSPETVDCIGVSNIDALLGAQYARAAVLFGQARFAARAARARDGLIATARWDETGVWWPYSTLHEYANDAAHAAYVVHGLDALEAPADLVAAARRHLAGHWRDGGRLRRYVRAANAPLEDAARAGSANDLGALLLTLCSTGDTTTARQLYESNAHLLETVLSARVTARALAGVATCGF